MDFGVRRPDWRKRVVLPRCLVAVFAGLLLALFLPPGMASAATVDERVTLDVTLDEAGTSTVPAFDPDLGTLTRVDLTVEVEVLVQGCLENRHPEAGSMVAGSLTGSLAVEVPTGADPTSAAVEAAMPAVTLPAGNGTDDCVAGFDEDTSVFPAPVTAPDTSFAEQSDATSSSSTLTGDAVEPFVGPGTVAFSYSPDSDTDLAVPAQWDAVSVAVGGVEVEVTYTYTAATAPTSGSGLPGTGASIGLALLTAALLLLGGSLLLVGRRRRSQRLDGTPTTEPGTPPGGVN